MSLIAFFILAHILTGALILLREKRLHGIDQSAAVANNNRGVQIVLLLIWPSLGLRLREVLACSLPAIALVLAFEWLPFFFLNTGPTIGLAAIMVLVVAIYALVKRANPEF
jgi:hypothetical protein